MTTIEFKIGVEEMLNREVDNLVEWFEMAEDEMKLINEFLKEDFISRVGVVKEFYSVDTFAEVITQIYEYWADAYGVDNSKVVVGLTDEDEKETMEYLLGI